MAQWGFVFLAYGIVWAALLLYILRLKRRYRRVQTELSQAGAAADGK